jgi:hypothetical protein
MTKKQFMEQLTDVLKKKYPDWQVTNDVFLKNNDTSKLGIMIRPPEENITPTIYIDDFYDDYVNKKSTISEIAEQIQKLMEVIKEQTAKYEEFAIDFESCKLKIIYRLISLEENAQMLQTCPYIPFLDLAITFHVLCSYTAKGLETMRITNQLLEQWQVGTKELMALAKENTPYHFPAKVESLQDVLKNYLGQELLPEREDIQEFSIILATNLQGVNGASILLYDNFVHELAEQIESNLYILPSSIHEILIMPETANTNLAELSQMVQSINREHVRREDVLSDHAYFYNREENKFYY